MLKIKFELNKNLDKKICHPFLFEKAGGIDFGKTIINNHPELFKIRDIKKEKERKKEISIYIDNYYKKHIYQLKNSIQEFKKSWTKKEKEFFSKVNKIFKEHPWPKGKYIGYISIFNCNPRFLKDKTFQIYYKNKYGVVDIISHELLHFIFYDYFTKNFKKDFKKISEKELWEISEIFNSVLFSFKPLSSFVSNQNYYPNLKKKINKAIKNWDSSKEIDDLINYLLNN